MFYAFVLLFVVILGNVVSCVQHTPTSCTVLLVSAEIEIARPNGSKDCLVWKWTDVDGRDGRGRTWTDGADGTDVDRWDERCQLAPGTFGFTVFQRCHTGPYK